MKRILVLYKELAGYFIACLEELCLTHQVQADVVAYPVHPDAPFRFNQSNRISLFSRNEITDLQLQDMVRNNHYDLIFTGGWFDKGYLQAVRYRSCPALLGFDNAWQGTFKQTLSALYGRARIKPLFDFAFVPGERQATFARKLGFPEAQIIQGAYSCDVNRFSNVKLQQQAKNRLVYAGRYSPEKHVTPLFHIFHDLAESRFPHWELHCIGAGPLWESRMQSPHITHHGFMQPNQLLQFMDTGNAFVLPSTFEPWGVVVHEFAAAGYPLVLSDAVGASERFLEKGKNGYLFPSGNDSELKTALVHMMSQSPDELQKMGEHSRLLAQKISPRTWADSIAFMMK